MQQIRLILLFVVAVSAAVVAQSRSTIQGAWRVTEVTLEQQTTAEGTASRNRQIVKLTRLE